ncbi:class IV adenylate cyclase [Acidovorax sp. SUPP2539]|uniref:class IV adenylate cyclase n=1 Tax=Acidovorax sp. SUPP2539 TaxID=2920878 RepID=UPI0023DE4F52|nr:class IV adenylate cyclase [Acidovorax sp. SUPP2539]GKS89698.1 class IV adenylate cyclase [Acidovorax sp. SUPP2539]
MPRNIEIKARLPSPGALAALEARAAALADRGPERIHQDDTFFRCAAGRLKLRAFSAGAGELIFYRRPDVQGPRTAFYVRTPTADPDGLREALTLAHGQAGRVVKERTLYLVGRTRVHLDRVAGLGEFMELEVVLDEAEPEDGGLREAHDLMARLGVAPAQWVDCAYVDLLRGRGG